MIAAPKAPLCKGGCQKSLIFDWGIALPGYEFAETLVVLLRLCGVIRGTSLYTREAWALPPQCDKR